MTTAMEEAVSKEARRARRNYNFLFALTLVGILLLLWVILTISTPNFLTERNIPNLLRQGSMIAILALGETFTIITAGIDLSVGAIAGFCTVVIAMLLQAGSPVWLAIVITLLVGLAIGALHYMPSMVAPPLAPPTPLVAYWWVLRDLSATLGAAVLTLGLGTGGLLYIYGDRRPSPLVHPNDLRDVAAILARGAVPCFFFATVAAGVALWRTPSPRLVDAWAAAVLFVLMVTSGLWWAQAERRQYKTGRGMGTLILTLILLAVYGWRRAIGAG